MLLPTPCSSAAGDDEDETVDVIEEDFEYDESGFTTGESNEVVGDDSGDQSGEQSGDRESDQSGDDSGHEGDPA